MKTKMTQHITHLSGEMLLHISVVYFPLFILLHLHRFRCNNTKVNCRKKFKFLSCEKYSCDAGRFCYSDEVIEIYIGCHTLK